MRFLLPLIVLWGVVFAIPFEVSAQPTLVQCGNTITVIDCDAGTGPGSGYQILGECTFCDFLKMGQNIINFMVYALAIVATLLFMYAGILYLTAAGNQGNISKAHSIFTNVFIGLIIVLAAWLIVDIVLSVLTGKKVGPWTAPICQPVDNPCRAKNPDTKEGEVEVKVEHCFECTLGTQPPTTICGESLQQCNLKRDQCFGTAGACAPKSLPGGGGGGGGTATMSPAAIAAACRNTAGYNATVQTEAQNAGISRELFRAIMMIESAGNPTLVSPAGAVGLMQIKIDTARPHFPSGYTDAQIRSELLNPQISMELASVIIEDFKRAVGNDPRQIVAAYNGGLCNMAATPPEGAHCSSRHCPSMRAWECPWDSLSPSDGQSCAVTGKTDCTPNEGFKETRNYAANMEAIVAAFQSGACTW